MFNRSKLVAAAIALASFTSFAADNGGLGSIIQEVGTDAVKGYLTPFSTVFGTGMNSGWYNTSKPYSMFGLPVGFSIAAVSLPVTFLSDDMKTFDLKGNIPIKKMLGDAMNFDTVNSRLNSSWLTNAQKAQILTQIGAPAGTQWSDLGIEEKVPFTAKDLPTVFGPSDPDSIAMDSLLAGSKTYYTVKAVNRIYKMQNSTGTDTINLSQQLVLPFVGIGSFLGDLGNIMPSMPGVTIEIGVSKIPVMDNLNIGLRFIPQIKLGDLGKLGQIGMKFQHEFLHYLPFAKSVPFLSASAMYAFNNLSISAGPATIDQSNWISGVHASADAKFGPLALGGFMGLCYEGSNLALDVVADSAYGLPAMSFDLPGDNAFRFTIGGRIKITVMELWTAFHAGSVNSFEVGLSALAFH